MEQLQILCLRRGGIGSDKRLDLVGGENSAERWLRVGGSRRKAPLLAKNARNGAPGFLGLID